MDMPVELRDRIHSASSKPGDVVRMKTHAPTLWTGGIVIPQGAKLTGRVTEAVPVTDERGARLGVAIERAEWKDKSIEMNAHVVGRVSRRLVRTYSDPRCLNARLRRLLDCFGNTTVQEDIFYRISGTIEIERGEHGTVLTSDKGDIVMGKSALLLFRQFEP